MEDFAQRNGVFDEDQLEQAIIGKFEQETYTHVNGKTIHRKPDEVLLVDDLRAYLDARYADLHLSGAETEKIINRLRYIPDTPLYDGNRRTFRLINEGFDLTRDDPTMPAVHIDYIDYDEQRRNILKVVNQLTVQGRTRRRPDVLLYVNGIPLVICEFKSAIKEDATIHDAWKQITVRYNRDIPNLTRYCCLAVISDGVNNRLGTVFTPYEYFYSWNRIDHGDKDTNGIGSLDTLIQGALAPDRLVPIIRDFIFYPDGDAAAKTPIVCRYPQYFGANLMLDSISRHLRRRGVGGDGKGGTYFGATGCGKTYTMLFLSRLMMLRKRKLLANPTIIVIVDREDLDDQTAEVFESAITYLHDDDVRSIETRADLSRTLKGRESGGIYVTTIQKFCESTGLLSERSNIICISDEAHRTQTGVNATLKRTDDGVFTVYGFAKYLRDSFPNATYCGFTGTPIDETLAVFGPVVDRYTMRQSAKDGITVPISYEPRLARVQLSEEQTRSIQEYYEQCAVEGATEQQIMKSQRAMSSLSVILENPDRLHKLAKDLVTHYDALCAAKPAVTQKAMVVCSSRRHAYRLYKEILALRPEWGSPAKAPSGTRLTKEQSEGLVALPAMNLVATRDADDEPELYDLCGTKEHRRMLDRQFKNPHSNFRVAIVVDMWITGFDVPCLSVMYIDKPLQKHTLIQTISRVNRVYRGKDQGLVVDYIGIKDNMEQAIKAYGDDGDDPVQQLQTTLNIFRNQLSILEDIMHGFDARDFFTGTPMARLDCLNKAAEFVQTLKDRLDRFMHFSRILRQAYDICAPSGELTDDEIATAQFYLAVRSVIRKQTTGNAPDVDAMNAAVEEMVRRAISCTGVENVVDAQRLPEGGNIFSEEFLRNLAAIDLPITKYNALIRLLRRSIREYGRTNGVMAEEFGKRLQRIVDAYNTRDNLQFVSDTVADFVDDLSVQLLDLLKDLEADRRSFEDLGLTYEEKAFYDILVKVRDDHGFPYEEEKCRSLAMRIRELVDDKSRYADWSTREDIKNELDMDLTVLLYENGYPPQWNDEVFEKVMSQATNYKEHES
ncbi:type I restriction endonuclease subunit R [Bifidobacterium parmae]|uniref:Type I restriction enzyme endonuclease subunit n=1 Tax=Bifidobacterium parmae TaxID=361854 RepID=A0A2N5IWK0_9BIFI|nr:type I restriction endonuclease subunit R [Bifidobacterium parmae]PLS26332.1 type I restriction endonuclease [Bifidobacterium parmae]